MIKVNYFGQLKEFTNCKEETISVNNIKDVLKYINKKYGKDAKKVAKRSLITVNGLRIEKFDIKIEPDSTISFFPICSGG